ncbi:hypothetical protein PAPPERLAPAPP_02230 [Brevundimonas phage vB_BpoS-Papperlapapp]|nr:hypothetical protein PAPPERLAPAPP_02230 [Brevundimonas phage vB_BpoS-Papperlapapp]
MTTVRERRAKFLPEGVVEMEPGSGGDLLRTVLRRYQGDIYGVQVEGTKAKGPGWTVYLNEMNPVIAYYEGDPSAQRDASLWIIKAYSDLCKEIEARRDKRLFGIPDTMRESLGYDQNGNAPHLLAEADRHYIDEVGVPRAGGDVVCRCGFSYYQHPAVQGALYYTRTCEGIVKL